MKTFIIVFFLCLNVSFSFAQQNFINVPSSEVTNKGKVFFQQQFNFNNLIQSNTTIDLGVGKGFEIGANVLGLNFNDKKTTFINNDTNDIDPYNPLLMINGLKEFHFTNNLSACIGGQTGLNYIDYKTPKTAHLIYGNLLLKNLLLKNSSIVLGGYYNSKHYGGKDGNRIGLWIGSEVYITQKFHIVAESILGHNALCYSSFGTVYYINKKIPLTFGVQIPNTKNNSYCLVFELTIVP